MATPANEVQVLADGIQANAPSKGSFALNMLFNNNSWQVRRGFGQVAQFDTQMSAPISGASTEWGFQKHLGSHLIRTNFGNLQLLSVFIADVNTSATGLGSTYSAVDGLYIVSIYDLSTNERFEVPLYRHTSQTAVAGSFHDAVPVAVGSRSVTLVNMEGAAQSIPQYQTASGVSYAAWIKAEDEFFYFQEYGDILYFGNIHAGMWAYIPASFNSLRPTTLDRVNPHESAMAYGESSMITPVVLSPGLHPAAFDYARTTDMSNPTSAAVVQDRMVYASGRQLFWSDPGYSNAIIVDNIMDVPSEEQVTCIAELNSNLVIFTQNETWFYQPSQGDVVTAGRLTKISDTVGCVGSTAFAKVEGSLVWVDTGGIYSTSNGLSLNPLSNDILPFFEGTGMASPVTSYFVSTPVFGHTTMSGEQPLTTLRMDPEGVKCSYMASAKLLVVSIPKLSGALVLSAGKWSWWTFESSVKDDGAGNAVVGVTQNIPSPWVLTYQDDMFAVGGPDVQALVDDAEYADGTDLDNDTTDRSFFILEYGRGGAIDRSITDEDDRKITGVGVKHEPAGTGAMAGYAAGVFFHDPIDVPVGYRFPVSRETAIDGRDYILVPVTVVLPKGVWDPSATPPEGVDDITIRLSFDRRHWEPVFTGTDANIDFLLPTERLGSARASGAHPPWSVATYTDATYATQSTTGSFFEARWIGSRSDCYHNPRMNLNEERHNLLMFLPFKRASGLLVDDTSAMGWADGTWATTGHTGIILDDSANGILRRVRFYDFRRWSLGSDSVRKDDSVAQPVDWAYKSTNVGLEEGKELKMRGTWSNLMSHGSATDKLNSAWPYGLFNTLVGSDRKEWITQVVDLSPTQAAVEQQDRTSPFESTQTLRTRVQKSDGSLTNKVFQTGGTDITWGDPSTQATGNLLIGDQDTSEISTSMSVKGQSFSVMVFGFIMNRAERLTLEGIKAAVRVVGGRRRRGR